MKNYYIVQDTVGDYLCVDVKHCCETPWYQHLSDIFTGDFCDPARDPEWRYYNQPEY